jgi:small subunit ribosomal protein S8
MSSDTIADFIAALGNAAAAGRETFVAPHSKLLHSVAEILVKQGFLKSVEKRGKKVTKTMLITLSLENGVAKFSGARRVSKLSRRVYLGSRDLRPVRRGFGMTIVTTTKGLLTDAEARKAKIGGEPLFQIW